MASGVISRKITNILARAVDAPIYANENSAQVTADTPAGYQFLCWTCCATVGFIGAPYMDTPTSTSTKVWTSIKPTAQKSVRASYLCYRSA